jgi:hypothetical protein
MAFLNAKDLDDQVARTEDAGSGQTADRLVSRSRLRAALSSRDPSLPAAVVPLIEAHAARLEQLPDDRWPSDPEAQARMLRSVQALYGLDAVTVGARGLVSAARECRSLGSSAEPTLVGEAASVALARDVIRRLRPVLGERSGIALVLPDASRLASLLGPAGETGWAAAVLAELVRALGPEEPDLILLCGDDPVDPMFETIAEFFGAALLPIGRSAPAGLVAATPEAFVRGDSRPGWLYTTSAEIESAADPASVRAAIERLRIRP